MPFPEAIAEAQRASLAEDIREAHTLIEARHRDLKELAGAHLIGLDAGDLSLLRAHVTDAERALFRARLVIERRPDA